MILRETLRLPDGNQNIIYQNQNIKPEYNLSKSSEKDLLRVVTILDKMMARDMVWISLRKQTMMTVEG